MLPFGVSWRRTELIAQSKYNITCTFLTPCPVLQDFLGEERLKKLLNWMLKYLSEIDVGLSSVHAASLIRLR